MSGALNVLAAPATIAVPTGSRPGTSPSAGTAGAADFGEALQTAVDAVVTGAAKQESEAGSLEDISAGTEQTTAGSPGLVSVLTEQTTAAPTGDASSTTDTLAALMPSNDGRALLLADASVDIAVPASATASDGSTTAPATARSPIPESVAAVRDAPHPAERESPRITAGLSSDSDVEGIAPVPSAAIAAAADGREETHGARLPHPVASAGPAPRGPVATDAILVQPAAIPGRPTPSTSPAADHAAHGGLPNEPARAEPILSGSSPTPAPLIVSGLGPAPSNPVGPPAPIAPAPTVPLGGQIAGPLFSLAAQGDGEHVLTINVTPDNLGPVTVRAHVSGETIRIELFAPNDAGREALRSVLPDLRRDFAGGGMGGSLELSSDNHPADRGDGQNGRFTGRSEPTNDRAAGATLDDHPVRLRMDGTNSIIDVMA